MSKLEGGVYDVSDRNWEPLYNKFIAFLYSWRQQPLSLSGKFIVLKVVALSKIIYRATVIGIPFFYVKRLEKEMFHFV